MASAFYWRKRIAMWFGVAFLCVVAVLVSAIALVVWYLHSGVIFPKWLALVIVNAVVVVAYLAPRFLGLVRNRMRITCDAAGLQLPSGRRLPCERLRDLNLGTAGRPPVSVAVARWPVPATIYLSCYENSEGLLQCLREYSGPTVSSPPLTRSGAS